jgi:hypothetical protein
MSESPFKFFRGTAIIQAHDLTDSPVSGIAVQACGDCHLLNFGSFATPERTLVFDINDFDETFPGPWEWDVKRLCASLVLAARDQGFSKQNANDAVRAGAASYRERMSEFGDKTELERWYAQIKSEDLLEYFRNDQDFVNRLKQKGKSARSSTYEAAFPKLAAVVKGRWRIKDSPPLIYHFQENVKDFDKINLKGRQEYRESRQQESFDDTHPSGDNRSPALGLAAVR